MNKQARKKLARCRVRLLTDEGFWSKVIMPLDLVEDNELVARMGTDGRKLYYNSEWVLGQKDDVLIGTMIHEGEHVAFLHFARMGSRDPRIWNIATDMSVNYSVEYHTKWPLPENVVKGKAGTAEFHYKELMKNAKQVKINLPQSGEGSEWDVGSVMEPQNADGSKASEFEKKALAEEWKIRVAVAAKQAQMEGKLPAELARMVKDLVTPKVNWREVIARFVSGFNREEYSWRRPHRRHMQSGFILPSRWSPGVAQIAVGVDTSGSISQDMLRDVVGEVFGCLQAYEERGTLELQVLWCDTKVYPQLVDDPGMIKPRGGGGTSFAPVFDWVREHGDELEGIVYVTDGWCSRFGEEPSQPVLWVLTSENETFRPPFGEVVGVIK